MPLAARTKVRGKNLIDPSKWVSGRIFDAQFQAGIWNYDPITNTVTITSGSGINNGMVSQMVEVTPNTNYVVSGVATASSFYVYAMSGVQIAGSVNSGTIFNSGDSSQLVIAVYRPSAAVGDVKMKDIQVESGSILTSFESFLGIIPDLAIAAQVRQGLTRAKKNCLLITQGDVVNNGNLFSQTITENIIQGASYTLSGFVTIFQDDTSTNPKLKIQVNYSDGTNAIATSVFSIRDGVERFYSTTINLSPSKFATSMIVIPLDWGTQNYRHISGRNFQIEPGTAATPFEPYLAMPDLKPVSTRAKKNMVPSFTDAKWSKSVNASGNNYTLILNATAAGNYSYAEIPVTPNTDYTLTVTHNARIAVYKVAGGVISGYTAAQQLTFNSGSESIVRVFLSNDVLGVGTYTFTNPQLEQGTAATPFEPYVEVPDTKLAVR